MRYFFEILTSGDLTLQRFQLKTGTPVTPPSRQDVHSNSGFSTPLCFQAVNLYATDEQRDGRTRRVMRPVDGCVTTSTDLHRTFGTNHSKPPFYKSVVKLIISILLT